MGELEVRWITEFEEELSRRKIFVKKGSAAFNHFAFFKSSPRARRMSDESMMIVFGSQVKLKFKNLDDLPIRFIMNHLGSGCGLS